MTQNQIAWIVLFIALFYLTFGLATGGYYP